MQTYEVMWIIYLVNLIIINLVITLDYLLKRQRCVIYMHIQLSFYVVFDNDRGG